MAFKVAEGFVELQPKIDKGQFQRKVRDTVRDSTKGVQPEADKGGTGIGKSFAAGFAGALSVDVVKGALGAIVGGASSLNETVSKTNVVFGENSEQIHQWAKGAEDSMGLSQKAAESSSNSLGLLFTQVGLNTSEASKMSQSWVQLASDLGSFNDADPTLILEAMSAATRGEYDSLQQFVPMINAATVEQKAMALTGKESNDMLNEQDKLLAINKLMFEQTGAAQGDFARTQDSVANQTKKTQAALENTADAMGSALLPAASATLGFISGSLIPTVREMGVVFSQLPPPIQIALASMTGIVVAGPPVVAAVRNIAERIAAARESLSGMSFAGRLGVGTLGVFGIAVAGATSLIAAYANQQAEAKQKTQEMKDALDATTAAVTEQNRVMTLMELRASGMTQRANELGIGLNDLVSANLGNADAQARVNSILETYIGLAESGGSMTGQVTAEDLKHAAAAKILQTAIGTSNQRLRDAQKAKREEIEVSKGAATENKKLGDEHQTAAQKAADQAKALQELITKLTALGRLTVSESEAEIAFQKAIDDATAAIDKNGKTLDINTAKGQDNQGALNSIVTTTLAWVESGARAKVGQDDLNKRLDAGAVAYAKQAEKLGMSQKEIDAYTQKVFGVPASKLTKLNADKRDADSKIKDLQAKLKKTHDKKTIAKISADIAEAQRKRRQIQKEIDALRDRTILIEIQRKTYYRDIYMPATTGTGRKGQGGRQSPGRAAGGPVYAGMLYTVNERGVEEFQFEPAMNGTVVPHHRLGSSPIYASPTAAATGGGGGITYTGDINVTIPVRDVMEFKQVTDLLSNITQQARAQKPFVNRRQTGRG